MKIGYTFTNKSGHTAEILNYFDSRNVQVIFKSGFITTLRKSNLIRGQFEDKLDKLVCGIAVNDLFYLPKEQIKHAYVKWTSMLQRCYGRRNSSNSCYKDVFVCEEWLTFSNFKSWMEKQDWEGKELDKDLIVRGNLKYGPDTCCFLTRELNSFLTTGKNNKNDLPLGVKYRKKNKDMVNDLKNPYQSSISVSGKNLHLGYFSSPFLAHKAWQKEKLKVAIEIYKKLEYPIKEKFYRVILDLENDLKLNIETKEI